MHSYKKVTTDGNTAAAHVAYAFTEVAAIYPITPSSVMADKTDILSGADVKNIFGSRVQVAEMQSEAGAAGAIHGALSAGALATTFTSSQGLLLMIPNMYKIAGELLPNVIHIAARAVATHALSIFGDHSDVYACRQTGYAMLCSNNPQESAHMAAVAHLSTIESKIPFMHFFDGFRTSHEIQKINLPSYDELEKMLNKTALEEFRKKALNPNNPVMRGTAQNDDVFFQNREAGNIYYKNAVNIVEENMKKINEKYSTNYMPFEYYGDLRAENIIIAMGSVCETIEEVIDYLNTKNEKTGLIKVRLYRPFSLQHLLSVLPSCVKKISVLDRTKEPGSVGEPLYLDVVAALKNSEFSNAEIYSGRYGLSSKNTTPAQIIAVYRNMNSKKPKPHFTVGINDDVTHLSLDITDDNANTVPDGTYSCKFWGIGSDGTVGASKNTIKIIGDNTDLNVQGFFSYDSKKSGGTTVSHLRFGKKPIKSTYYVDKADFVGCHSLNYIYKYDILKDIKPGGSFLLNCDWDDNQAEKTLPAKMKKTMYEKHIKFYVLDSVNISKKLGLGGRVNTALQAAFFKITNIFPQDKALMLIKQMLSESYAEKGEETVKINHACAEEGTKNVKEISVPETWKNAGCSEENLKYSYKNKRLQEYTENIVFPINEKKGDSLPVSAFLPYADGTVPTGASAYEKREISSFVPRWKPENCIECNLCSYVCPHAVIRPAVTTQEELLSAPKTFKHKKIPGMDNLNFSITVSAKDCTGCGNCAEVCPGLKGNKALEMSYITDQPHLQEEFDYANQLPYKHEIDKKFKISTVKGSQFKKPLLEFSGACAGCGETPYAKLATQLFGDKMIIANATGCSSIWSASFPSSAYASNEEGKGPAWHNSLFEDNAEFGYGMALAQKSIRSDLLKEVETIKNTSTDPALKNLCDDYIETYNSSAKNSEVSEKLIAYLQTYSKTDIPSKSIKKILGGKNTLAKKSLWIFGGDGWAYDIGFGGLDHVVASGENVNILIFDTEVYSNTGGQASKATPACSVAQFASKGKITPKKDLASMFITYKYVYVAQVALGANYAQCVKAFTEAENYNGPSVIIAYSPCINHGIKGGMKNSLVSAKQAVESGYWNLFRFNPEAKQKNLPSVIFDSPNISVNFKDFLVTQSRYNLLKKTIPEKFDYLSEKSEKCAHEKYQFLKNLSQTHPDDNIKNKITV